MICVRLNNTSSVRTLRLHTSICKLNHIAYTYRYDGLKSGPNRTLQVTGVLQGIRPPTIAKPLGYERFILPYPMHPQLLENLPTAPSLDNLQVTGIPAVQMHVE